MGVSSVCVEDRERTSAPGSIKNALGYRPEPEVLPLPAETSREAAKCCACKGGGAPKRARVPSRA